jgi:alginate O-acetyltransferase complex protein AlgI
VQVGSGVYFVFVAAVFLLYWVSWAATGSRVLRLAIVLLANYFFCAHFGLFYILLIPLCSTADFLVGLGLVRFENAALRRLLVTLSILLNLGLLIGSRHMGMLLKGWDWIFPLGLSFYVFQSLTYTIDLYRRDGEATTSLVGYLSAASFFPTLQAGPITRLTDLIKQFATPAKLTREDGGRAFFLIGLGLLKKSLIADYLGQNLVNRVFDTPNLYSGSEVLAAVYAYSLQLYFDFSGYTDIARGVGLLLGVRLPINFDHPYQSTNLTEFWRRWHITFSQWLREYLYFSLPGKRTKVMPYINLVITMVLGGLWHGITWTFGIWGLLHGMALAATHGFRSWRGRPKPIGPWKRAVLIFLTYQFVCLTWLFFRASSLANARALLERIASLTTGFDNLSLPLVGVMLLAAATFFISKESYSRIIDGFARSPIYVHIAALFLIALALQFLGGRGSAPFVYSRF